MASTTAADMLVDTLTEWGVEIVFGMPGDGINGIMEALRKRQDKIRFIQVRHEEAAAFMACGYAKWTGRLGVCLATSGPGGIHLLNGLYDAKLDGQPVLAITGLQYHDLVGTSPSRTSSSTSCSRSLRLQYPRSWARRMSRTPWSSPAARRWPARRRARHDGRRHAVVPVSRPALEAQRRRACVELMAEGAHVPSEDQLARAAAILNAGRKVGILAGRGALGARDEVIAVAERLGAPIVKPLLGKGVVPDDHPLRPAASGSSAPRRRRTRSKAATRSSSSVELSLHRVLPQARAGEGGADRHRPAAHRPALSASGRARRRRAASSRRCSASSNATTTARSSRRRRTACTSGASSCPSAARVPTRR